MRSGLFGKFLSQSKHHNMKTNKSPNNIIELEFSKNNEAARYIQKLLNSRRKAEALRWLSGSKPGRRRVIGVFRGHKQSLKFVQELYATGALKVIATDIKSRSSILQRSDKLLLMLPANPLKRAALFQWCERQRENIGYHPEIDQGETQIYIYLG